MEEISIRLLRAEEIECRVGVINERGLSLLLYKDARVDQKILDETFTTFGWKRSHQSIDGNLYCTVEVWDKEKGQWISKQDVGTMSYAEKEKGQASDSFKRTCVNFGIGRELYTAPFIWIPAESAAIQHKDNKYYTLERFQVHSIQYDKDRNISMLSIVNSKKQIVYSVGKADTGKEKTGQVNERQMEELRRELRRTGVAMGSVLDRYHLQSPNQLTSEIYEKAMDCLKRSKDRDAA